MNTPGSTLFICLVVLSLGLSTSYTAHAQKGGMDSGGGNAVVCRNPNGSIRSAELFDLFEGRALLNWRVSEAFRGDPRSYAEIAKNIGAKIDIGMDSKTNGKTLELDIQDIDRQKQLLPQDTGVNVIDDSLSPIVPKGCTVMQTAAYMEAGSLYIDQEIWLALNKTSKAALLVHEALYKKLRTEAGEKNSIRTRRAVAAAFSGHRFEPIGSGSPAMNTDSLGSPALVCVGKGTNFTEKMKTTFTIFPISDGNNPLKVRIQFASIDGFPMLSKTYLDKTIGGRFTSEDFKTWALTADIEAWSGGIDGQPLISVVDFDKKIFVGLKRSATVDSNDSQIPGGYQVAGIYRGDRPHDVGLLADPLDPSLYSQIECALNSDRDNPIFRVR